MTVKRIVMILFLFLLNINNADAWELDELINHASKETGVSTTLLKTVAFKESSFKFFKNNSSSAVGLFQFKEKTFRELLYKYGNDYEGLAMDADINCNFTQTMLAAIYVKQNSQGLKKFLGREPTPGEVYMAHFLGPTGAKRILGSNLKLNAKDVVSYAYNQTNRRWFVTSKGNYRTVSQFRDYFNYKFSLTYNKFKEE